MVHTVSEGSGGLLRETAHYSGGFLCCRGFSLPALSHDLMQLLLVVSLWHYQLRLLPKTHNSQTRSRKSTGSGQPQSVTGQFSREETVWHTIGVIMTNKKK